MACGAGAPAMVPEGWECHRSWVRAWPEGGERRTVNGSGHEHRPTGRRKSRKSVVQKAALRRGRYAWHCVLKAIAGITALGASLLYSSTQRVVRNCAWAHKAASRRRGRRSHADQYCAARRAVLLSGPPSHILQEARASRIKLPLKRERDSGTFAPAFTLVCPAPFPWVWPWCLLAPLWPGGQQAGHHQPDRPSGGPASPLCRASPARQWRKTRNSTANSTILKS